eukprot:m.43268 g.43268  ORF g.43268 m.43268 type:complete len:344 (-) comp14682_c0_seq1:176-1207(-)
MRPSGSGAEQAREWESGMSCRSKQPERTPACSGSPVSLAKPHRLQHPFVPHPSAAVHDAKPPVIIPHRDRKATAERRVHVHLVPLQPPGQRRLQVSRPELAVEDAHVFLSSPGLGGVDPGVHLRDVVGRAPRPPRGKGPGVIERVIAVDLNRDVPICREHHGIRILKDPLRIHPTEPSKQHHPGRVGSAHDRKHLAIHRVQLVHRHLVRLVENLKHKIGRAVCKRCGDLLPDSLETREPKREEEFGIEPLVVMRVDDGNESAIERPPYHLLHPGHPHGVHVVPGPECVGQTVSRGNGSGQWVGKDALRVGQLGQDCKPLTATPPPHNPWHTGGRGEWCSSGWR